MPAGIEVLIQQRRNQLAAYGINAQAYLRTLCQFKRDLRGGIERVRIILMQREARHRLAVFRYTCGRQQAIDHGVDGRDIDAVLFITNNALLIDDNGPIVGDAIGHARSAGGAAQRIGHAGGGFEDAQLPGRAVVIIQSESFKSSVFARLINFRFRGWTSRAAWSSVMPHEKKINDLAAMIGQFDLAVIQRLMRKIRRRIAGSRLRPSGSGA